MKIGKLSVNEPRMWKSICTFLLFCAAATIGSFAQTFTTLVSFDGSNGGNPQQALVQGLNGNLYGTTTGGDSAHQFGTVFEMTPAGTLNTLHTFSGGSDGLVPLGLVQASSGNFLYGTTLGQGTGCARVDCGTVFKITPSGTLSTLHVFNSADGSEPTTLMLGIDGNLYGATSRGGNIKSCVNNFTAGCGTVYKVTPAGQLTTLYAFCLQQQCADGALPRTLIQAGNGMFYGITYVGGSPTCKLSNLAPGCGTLYEISASGTFKVLHLFGGSEGVGPVSLIQGADGQLYGTTSSGGENGWGTIFTVGRSGTVTPLHAFSPSEGGGNLIIQTTDGNFYGTAFDGGANGYGTIFEVTPTGTLTVLHNFSVTDGEFAEAPLVQSTSGKFYGTTEQGANNLCVFVSGCGTVFSLDTGLGPFVTFVVKAAKVGKTAEILGQGLTGTTSVSFNGVAASFKVRSDTFLTATVPAGASTGLVTVTTSSGTLTSNVAFQILP
jgi:uncharacterized repeat protein (TIGR03803 family)